MRPPSLLLTALLLVSAPALAQTAPATTPATTAPATKPGMTMPMAQIAVNTATEAQIAAIPGVGAKLAAAIVKARPFKNRADLIKRVKGIGPKNYVKLGLDKLLTY